MIGLVRLLNVTILLPELCLNLLSVISFISVVAFMPSSSLYSALSVCCFFDSNNPNIFFLKPSISISSLCYLFFCCFALTFQKPSHCISPCEDLGLLFQISFHQHLHHLLYTLHSHNSLMNKFPFLMCFTCLLFSKFFPFQ